MLKQNEVIELINEIHLKIQELKNGEDVYIGVAFEQRYNELIKHLSILKKEMES